MSEVSASMMTAFEERLKNRQERQEADEAQTAEQLRQDYLQRTGRTEMKP